MHTLGNLTCSKTRLFIMSWDIHSHLWSKCCSLTAPPAKQWCWWLGIFPSLILLLLEKGLSELGINRRNELFPISDWAILHSLCVHLIKISGAGAFSSCCVLPNSGWLVVSSVFTGELKLYGLYVHTPYKNRVNTHEIFPPSILPASNTCASPSASSELRVGFTYLAVSSVFSVMTYHPVDLINFYTKYCGKGFHSLTTRYMKNCLAFALHLPCVGLIKSLDFALKKMMKN